jgi:hypothetical protein
MRDLGFGLLIEEVYYLKKTMDKIVFIKSYLYVHGD